MKNRPNEIEAPRPASPPGPPTTPHDPLPPDPIRPNLSEASLPPARLIAAVKRLMALGKTEPDPLASARYLKMAQSLMVMLRANRAARIAAPGLPPGRKTVPR